MTVTSAMADTRRPIKIHAYPPSASGVKPVVPEALIDLFLAEVEQEPHQNQLICTHCNHTYFSGIQGAVCTATDRCRGTLRYTWDQAIANAALQAYFKRGEMALCWDLAQPPVPCGFCVCEVHGLETIVDALGLPMNILTRRFPRPIRPGPYLVISHLWLQLPFGPQYNLALQELIKASVKLALQRLGSTKAHILIPVNRKQDDRRVAIEQWLRPASEHRFVEHDPRISRHRSVLGFKHYNAQD